MRCTGYCTASSYEVLPLFQFLHQRGKIQLYRDVVHLQIKEEKRTLGDAFFFSYGTVVLWGFSEQEEEEILQELKAFERHPFARTEIDEFTFSYGENMKIHEDLITLQNKNVLTKLAISYGIAQSIKLTIFEETIQKTIEHTTQIPTELAKKGKIPLSRKEISKKMGELFIERNSINLHTEILDTPEFFWEHPEFETFYRRTTHYLDVSKRIDAMNKRLTVIHELFEILSSELNHQHSARLELTIICLIVIEVILILMKDVFHLL
jgi:uncharacterized Rmd1/YagE family protein